MRRKSHNYTHQAGKTGQKCFLLLVPGTENPFEMGLWGVAQAKNEEKTPQRNLLSLQKKFMSR